MESVPKVASVTEWLDLMCRSERRTGISLLTDDQKESIRQFDTEIVEESLHLNVAEFLTLIQRLAHCGPDDYMSSETSSVLQPFNSPATPPPNNGEYRPYLEPPTAAATATNPARSRSLTPRQQGGSTSASPRPQASSSLDHRQRTTHLLNQVQQRLQRSDRHRDERDDDDSHGDDDQDGGRVSPSTNHPSVSAVSVGFIVGHLNKEHDH